MPRYTTQLTRLAVLGLSVGVLLPATAGAMPINDGQAPAQPVPGQSVAAVGGGDVVSGGGYRIAAATNEPGPPVFPTNTKPLPQPAAANPSDDGGVDTGVLVAIGAAVLLALGAVFLVVARKPRTRERQPA